MKCPCCGRDVDPTQMDVAFRLPDPIFDLAGDEREARARVHSDLCSLDDTRYFIRGVIYVRIQRLDSEFGWGVWAEVPAETFFRYRDRYDKDGSAEPPASGILANTPPGYEKVEQALDVHFGPPDQRPTFRLLPSGSQLYLEQIQGLPVQKWHDIVEQFAH